MNQDNKIFNCSACKKDYPVSKVQKIQAGSHTAYMCNTCGGPCFEKDESVKDDTLSSNNEPALLSSKKFPVWGKFLIGIFLCGPLILYIIWNIYISKHQDKQIKKIDDHFKKIEEKQKKGQSGDLFDTYEIMMDKNQGY